MTAPEDCDLHLQRVVRTVIGSRGVRICAELSGASTRTIHRAMNGKNIRVDTLRRIAASAGYRVHITLEKDTK
jgi:hypothetical protein